MSFEYSLLYDDAPISHEWLNYDEENSELVLDLDEVRNDIQSDGDGQTGCHEIAISVRSTEIDSANEAYSTALVYPICFDWEQVSDLGDPPKFKSTIDFERKIEYNTTFSFELPGIENVDISRGTEFKCYMNE